MSFFMRSPHSRGATALFVVAVVLFSAGWVAEEMRVGNFSAADPSAALPEGWEPLTFKKIDNRTQYTLTREQAEVTVVKAVSDGGASGLIHRQTIDPKQFPVIAWRWKVAGVLANDEEQSKSGDDYPARIYVTFAYDEDDLSFFDKVKLKGMKVLGYDEIPLRALSYVWASNAPVGEMYDNPYTDWVQMLPVESGGAKAGTWASEERNVLEDYRAAFGEDPPPISGVAIMTDTDDTEASATAYYGDIVFRSEW